MDRMQMLYETCCPPVKHVPESPMIPQEQDAEKAGEVAEKAIEDIKPETSTGETPTASAEGAESEISNESTEGNNNE